MPESGAVRTIGSRAFLDLWTRLYAASNQGLSRDRWSVGKVQWTRDKHSYRGGHYSSHLECHVLEHPGDGKTSWRLWVVVEIWWDNAKEDAVRHTRWCRLMKGRGVDVLTWLQDQARLFSL